jgi:fructose-bisphosphate aldolase class I
MRSVISAANAEGHRGHRRAAIRAGQEVLAKGLVPILEPEVTISIADKAEAEDMLLAVDPEAPRDAGSADHAEAVAAHQGEPLRAADRHPKVLRVVALSGGYSRDEANKLAQNTGMIASFSRALTEGLSHGQSDAEFDATLAATIDSIFEAIAGLEMLQPAVETRRVSFYCALQQSG